MKYMKPKITGNCRFLRKFHKMGEPVSTCILSGTFHLYRKLILIGGKLA
jgi:hypothetical protein